MQPDAAPVPQSLGAVAFLEAAKLRNGTCPTCGKINAYDGSPRCDCPRESK